LSDYVPDLPPEPAAHAPGAADPAPARRPEPNGQGAAPGADGQWRLWEVFVQEEQGAPHEHAGSVRATDAEHALQNARDVYARRGKPLSMWVVPTETITASRPDDAGPFFEMAGSRPYVHPHFYKVPRGIKGV
jgi:ring-1,2-phenylacetyl-CoA epoxidase subunit PaaB